MPKRLTNEEKEQILARYGAGESAAAVSAGMGRDLSIVYDVLKAADVPLQRQAKYAFDHRFFDEVDSEEKAYMLGFLYADGHNGEEAGRWRVAIALAARDREILDKFRGCLKTTRPLGYYAKTNQYTLSLFHPHFSKRLTALGCHNNKSFTLLFPEWMPPVLLPHFVRGYIDGDGWVTSIEKQQRMGAVGSIPFINRLAELIEQYCGVKVGLSPNRKTPLILTAQIAGRDQTATVLAWLYKDATVYLERKKRKAEEILVPTYLLRHYGSASHLSTLNEETVRQIKADLLAGVPTRQIKQKYGIRKEHLTSIRNGKTWNHVTGWGANFNQAGELPKGLAHYACKLTEGDVRAMMLLFDAGKNDAEIGAQYGMTRGAVLAIRKGRRYVDITGYELAEPGRTRLKWRNANPKLTDEQADEIRTQLLAGESGNSLAKRYGVSASTISDVKHRAGRYSAEPPT